MNHKIRKEKKIVIGKKIETVQIIEIQRINLQ